MESLNKRKTQRAAIKNDPAGFSPITDEDTKFVHPDELPDLMATAAQIDVNIAKTDADARNIHELETISAYHGKKAEDKAQRQAQTAKEDAEKASKPPTENQKQGAQPETAEPADKKATHGGSGGGWKANK